MPRTKGSKNRVTASTDFDAQIAKLQKDKATLEEGLSKTVAQIEELKTDIKSLRESLKPQKAEIKQTEKEIVCGQVQVSPSSRTMQLPSSQQQHSRRIRLAACFLCAGVMR